MIHTPEPWQQKHDWDVEGATTIIANVDAEIDSEGTHYSYDTVAICRDQFDECLPEAQANARRIVACVNALSGISTDQIEAGVVQGLVSAAEKLSNAEHGYRLCHDMKGDGHTETGRAWDYMRKCGDELRTALSRLAEASNEPA